MSNVPTAGNGNTAIAALGALKSNLANVRGAIPTTGGNPFLRMGKDGTWVYGADDTEVSDDQVWAVNVLDIRHGWIAWKEREQDSKDPARVLGERMVLMSQPKPEEHSLPHVEEGKWTNQIDIPLKGVGGEDADIEVNFKTNSVGGLNEAGRLVDAIMKQLDINPEKFVPLVKLTNDHYKHKVYGKIYTPVFDIVGWTSIDVPEQAATPAEQEAASMEPEGPAPEEAAAEAAPAATEDAPVRTRTRRRG